MALPNWWQVTTPHKDIREGKLSEAVFAADLGDVVAGKAPIEYCDASTFFEKTYLTKGLKNLLENVLERLCGGKGDPVIQLQTPFGGGKTHSLLTLYHAVENRDKLKYIDLFAKLPRPKKARVVVFVGTQPDAIKGKTPWGEIAQQLGAYEKVKEHDIKRISPGKKILDEVLGDDPVLILIDEIVEYVVKAKEFADQISVFSQEITETVKAKDNCCLVCTLPSSAMPYGESGERALSALQRIYGRVEAIYTPVEGVEIYEIIRKRLFEDYGDQKIIKKVAQSYFDFYQKLGADVPSEVKEINYREKIEHAYPFHPELIDVLYERWSSFPTFQRTRGVLRLLAQVVADQYQQRVTSPLIHSSLVNLENQVVRRELVRHIGNEYEAVIAADIAGKNAKAPKIDKEIGSEYEKYGIASGIATSVFLYSFSGAEKKGTTLPKIRVALLREGIPPTIVGDAINKLDEELWYFHSERKLYSFRNQPNLNKVRMDKEETIAIDKIQEEIKVMVQDNAGRTLEVYIWPESSADIPDNKNLKLAILSPDIFYNSAKLEKFVAELYEKAGIGYRVYKNTLFIISMDENQTLILTKALKQFLALTEIQNDKDLVARLTKESQDELKKKTKETEKEIPFKILTAYRHLAMYETKGIIWQDLGIPTTGSGHSISERVKQYLKDQEKLLTRLTPKYILDKSFGKDEDEKPLKEIYELHLKTPGMPLLESPSVLLDAVRDGVRTGILGLKENRMIFHKQDVPPNIDSIVMRGEVAEKLKTEQTEKTKEGKVEIPISERPEETGLPRPELIEPKKRIVKKVFLRVQIPWDKISDLLKGVIRPLKDKGKPPEITIEIKADSEEGFDRTTLDSKVKETLQQIGASIDKWEES